MSETAPTAPRQRDEQGCFVPGHAKLGGRQRRGWDRLVVVDEVVTRERWRNVLERALADAEAGDRHARDWLTPLICPLIRDELTAEKIDVERERAGQTPVAEARGAVWGEDLPPVGEPLGVEPGPEPDADEDAEEPVT